MLCAAWESLQLWETQLSGQPPFSLSQGRGMWSVCCRLPYWVFWHQEKIGDREAMSTPYRMTMSSFQHSWFSWQEGQVDPPTLHSQMTIDQSLFHTTVTPIFWEMISAFSNTFPQCYTYTILFSTKPIDPPASWTLPPRCPIGLSDLVFWTWTCYLPP